MNQLSTIGNELVHALQGENGEDILTEIRLKDGFVNATKLCKSAGKQWYDYYRLKTTQTFLKVFQDNAGIPGLTIIESEVGGNHEGTWVHPDIAIDLARWCSPQFQVKIANLVRRYLCGELTTKESKEAQRAFQQRLFITDYNNKNVVYVGLVDTEEFKGAKVGYTDDIVRREKEHKNDMGSFKLVKVYEVINNRQIERVLLTECSSRDVRTSAFINGKNQTELIKINDEFTLEDLLQLVDTVIDKTKTQMIEDMRNDLDLEKEKERTKQLELQYEIDKIRKEEYDKIEQAKRSISETKAAFEAALEEKENNVLKIKEEYEQKIKDLEKELKKNEPESIDPYKELDAYFEKFCEFGEDTIKHQYRVICDDLYEHYCKHIRVPTKDYDLKEYIKNKYNIDYKPANWYNNTKNTWFGMRLKDFVTKKRSVVQNLIIDFINIKCQLGDGYMVDTKIFYDNFEEYAKDKDLDTIKKNGFTRQIFKKELLDLFRSISKKDYAIGGKKHAFTGVKLIKSQMQPIDAVKEFIRDHCVFGPGYRVKNKDLFEEFNKFYGDQKTSRIKFHEAFRDQCPNIQRKSVTKSEMGYIGVILRKDYINTDIHE